MARVIWGLCVAAVVLASPFSAPSAATRTITPGADWCAEANSLEAGDELRLAAGDYPGGCTLRSGGRAGAPIVIRAADPAVPPRIASVGRRDNIVNVATSFVVLRSLRFGPSEPDVDAIRVKAGDDITVEDCAFIEVAGIAIASNTTTTRGLRIVGNDISKSKATAIYLGCHDGAACQVTDIVIERNRIAGVEAPPGSVGYGIQIKLNSSALIRDNVITDTKGPGIMVYGARTDALTSIVERNFVANARASGAIVVGGGPAVISNNIVVRAGHAGISLEDYGKRGLLRGIVVVNNTVYGAVSAGISVPLGGRLGSQILYNASHSLTGSALPAARSGLVAIGNVDCRFAICFSDPAVLDFSPAAGSALLARAPQGPEVPREDFFGATRPVLAAAGALEPGDHASPISVKSPSWNERKLTTP